MKPILEKGSTRERGAAAVEFALLLPIILMLVFGMIDLGVWLNQKITLNEAARQGVRAYVLTEGDADDKREAALQVVTATTDRAAEDYDLTATPCAKGDDDEVATVSLRVSYTSRATVGLLPKNSVTLVSRAVMACVA